MNIKAVITVCSNSVKFSAAPIIFCIKLGNLQPVSHGEFSQGEWSLVISRIVLIKMFIKVAIFHQ